MNESKYKLGIYIDRYDDVYKADLDRLLSKDSLISNSEIIAKNESHFGAYERRISIKFCGLSGMSILGGTETQTLPRPIVVSSFLNLISNHENIVQELNDNGIYVDVKIMFAYPYSDFMYDLIQAENTFQDGFSTDCILKGKKANIDLRIPNKLTYANLKQSITYQHLKSSLEKVQIAVNESRKLFNHEKSANRLVVKLTPLNILTCFLKINHNIFIDPYVYSKEKHTTPFLSLTAPISTISIPEVPSLKDLQNLNEKDKKILNHYFSLINHFRYIWQHPLTMYSTDATKYDKGVNGTLKLINEPYKVSYLSKSIRIEKELLKKKRVEKFEVDLWRQYCKNELYKYCSKYLSEVDQEVTRDDVDGLNINPIPIFIVGSWKQYDTDNFSDPNPYMNLLKEFFNKYFVNYNIKGLKLNPIIVDSEDGIKIQDQIFQNLNSSQLGIVVQTSDLNGTSKPNVYFERGYLMGRLSKRKSRLGKEKEMVFVFKEIQAIEGSDFSNITHTPFTNIEDFKIQFFRIVKWLWDMTELNSDYALTILTEYKNEILTRHQLDPKNELLGRLERLNEGFIEHIQRWEKDYQNRMNRLSDE